MFLRKIPLNVLDIRGVPTAAVAQISCSCVLLFDAVDAEVHLTYTKDDIM